MTIKPWVKCCRSGRAGYRQAWRFGMNPHVVLNPSILTGGILFEIPRNGIYLQFEGFEVSREGVHEVYFPNGGHAE